MKILLVISILIIAILFIGKNLFYSAQKNLFKDHATWSGKDIKIKYTRHRESKESKGNDNYLKTIADESKIYLDNQSEEFDSE